METQHTVPLSRSERGMGMEHPSEMPAHGTNSVIKLSFNMFYFMFYCKRNVVRQVFRVCGVKHTRTGGLYLHTLHERSRYTVW